MLWDVAWQNIWRRRGRTALTILAIAVVAQLYVTMASMIESYEQNLQRQLGAMAGQVAVQRPMVTADENEGFPSFSSSIPAGTAAQVLALDGVDPAASSAVLFVALAPPSLPEGPPALVAVGIEPGHEPAFLSDLAPESGAAALPGSGHVLLGKDAARQLAPPGSQRATAGQTVTVQGRRFVVAGVLRSRSWLIDGAVLLPLAEAQELFARPDSVSAVMLTAARVEDVAGLEASVEARFPDLQASGQSELARSASAIIDPERALFHGINMMIISSIIILLAVVMAVTVMDQRGDIGTLRAIGASRRAIAGLVAGQALVLSLAGTLLAWPLWAAVYAAFLQDSIASLDIAFVKWLTALALALVVGVLAALIPAWQAARVDPVKTLRYE